MHTFPTGRGICSTESIYKGDSVFTVHDVITPRHIFQNSPQLVDSISKAQDEDNIYSIFDEIREKKYRLNSFAVKRFLFSESSVNDKRFAYYMASYREEKSGLEIFWIYSVPSRQFDMSL